MVLVLLVDGYDQASGRPGQPREPPDHRLGQVPNGSSSGQFQVYLGLPYLLSVAGKQLYVNVQSAELLAQSRLLAER